MMRSSLSARRWAAIGLTVGAVLLQACGGDSGGTTTPTPSLTVSINPSSATVAQGGSTTVNATATGANGFTGVPAVTVTGLPTGVTIVPSNLQTSGTTTTVTVTVNVAATTAPGTYQISVNASGPGVTAVTTNFSLTVTAAAAGGYTLSASPATVSVTQGGAAATTTINIARTGGFAGSVALAVTGAPANVTATLSPTSTTTNSSTLTVTAAAAATPGSATLTVTGTATGVANQTVTIPLTVAASTGGSGNLTIDFSACATADKPIWLAVQNGTTGWTSLTATADVYRTNITQTRGGIAYATQAANGATSVFVQYYTQAELTAATLNLCARIGGPKTLSGTVAGLALGDAASISLGGAFATPTTNGPFTLNGVANGNQDLVAARYNILSPGTSDRLIIRRNQNIATGGTIPVIDFGAAEAFAPATATATVTGAGSEQVVGFMNYFTGSCASSSLGLTLATGSTFTMRGVPAAQQAATDFHQVFVVASGGTTATAPTRGVFETFRTLANRTIALGVALPTPTVTSLSGAYKRLQAVLTLPSDYQQSLTLVYFAGNRTATVTASFGWLGGATATLAFPDFAGVTGWQDAWMPASSATVTWTVTGTGVSGLGASNTVCAEGARMRIASASGTL